MQYCLQVKTAGTSCQNNKWETYHSTSWSVNNSFPLLRRLLSSLATNSNLSVHLQTVRVESSFGHHLPSAASSFSYLLHVCSLPFSLLLSQPPLFLFSFSVFLSPPSLLLSFVLPLPHSLPVNHFLFVSLFLSISIFLSLFLLYLLSRTVLLHVFLSHSFFIFL